jgi:hypothetical protein
MTRSGWYPDPSGRYPKRWFDGNDWTASVLDNGGQQAYDQLPPAGAPSVAALPAAASPPRPPASSAPPPPPGGSSVPAPSPWAPETSWQSAPSQSAQPHTPMTSGGVWARQQPVTTASLGLTPPPAVSAPATGRSAIALVIGTIGLALIAVSMFVLDWGPDATFSDIRTSVSDLDPSEWADKIVKYYTEGLGYLWLGITGLAVAFAAGGRRAVRRSAHVGAALLAGLGAVLATFVIVRLFRGPGADPEFGAWLLTAGYLVMLAGVAVSARRH